MERLLMLGRGVATLRAGLAAAILLAPWAGGATAAEPSPHLAPFKPFVGKTWRGLVDPGKGVYDVARWELALNDQAVRILHSVGDGAYGGETLVVWDRDEETLVYYYFTTAGFYTRGTMRADDEGRLHSREEVTGHGAGVTEVRAIQEVLPDGRLRVRTRMLRDGEWEERPEVIYEQAPRAEVVLP
jgi:hypothetical protein